MSCRCNYFSSCIIPIILGIIGAILVLLFEIVAITVPFLFIAFGIAVLGLSSALWVALLSEPRGRREGESLCACKYGKCLVLGSVGALVTSIIGIAGDTITLALTFFVVGFLIWTIVALALLLFCLIENTCD